MRMEDAVDEYQKIWCFVKYVVIFCGLLALSIGGCQTINQRLKLDNDNPCEEFLEGLIEKELGVSVDLTP